MACSPKGQLLINVNRISGNELQLTIHAKPGVMSLDREVKYPAAFGSQEVLGGRLADNDLGRRLAGLLYPSDPAQPGQTECGGGMQCVNGEPPLPSSAGSFNPGGRLAVKLVRYNPPADSTLARGPQ